MRHGFRLDLGIVGLALTTLAAFSIHRIVSHDIWWQLATGEFVLEHGWPQTDPFSYGETARPWVEMRWLFCVAAFVVFKQLGLNYLIVGKTVVLLGIGALLIRLRRGGALWASAAGIAIFSLMAHPRFLVRPEILTFAFLAIFLERLDSEGSRLSRRSLALLAVAQLLWVNSHSTFLVGPAVLWIFAIADGGRILLETSSLREAVTQVRGVLVAAAVTTGVCLANPYLLTGFLFPIRLLTQIHGDHPLNSIIQEFASPLSLGTGSAAFRVLLIGGSLAGASFALRRRRDNIAWMALWLTFLGLALTAQRNVALLAVVSAVVVVRNLRDGERTSGPWVAALCRGTVFVFALVLIPSLVTDAYAIRSGRPERFGFGVSEHRLPFGALDFVRREGLPRPVIGKLGDGGAFLFEGGPESTFVDGRLEVYSIDFIRRYRRALGSREAWDAATQRHNVRTAVLKHTETQVTIQFLESHQDWVAVYLDSGYVVFLNVDPETEQLAQRLAIDWDTAEPTSQERSARFGHDWLAGRSFGRPDPVPDRDLGRLFLGLGRLERSRNYFRRAYETAPGRSQTRAVLGLLERALGREEEAAALLDPLPDRLVRSLPMMVLQAQLYERNERPGEALEAYAAALAGGGRDFGSVVRMASLTQQPTRAIDALQRAADHGAQDPELLTTLGVLYLEHGQPERAAEALRASLELSPGQPQVLNQLGILSARRGRLDDARGLFEQALVLDPQNSAARTNLERLRTSSPER